MNFYKIAISTILFFNFFSMANAVFDLDRWGHPAQKCVKYWEWTLDQDMVINDKQYYGFQMDGSVGTFTLPLYDNPDLEGEPIARIRGNMITEPSGGFTANTALYFFEDEAYLGVNLSFTYDPTLEDDFIYGFTVGGTGKFRRYNAFVTTVVIAQEPKFTVEWELCFDGRMW